MKTLRPIIERPSDYEEAERLMREAFKREIYMPLMVLLTGSPDLLANGKDALLEAIRRGTITFSKGGFYGQFNARVSRELRELGATFDRKSQSFRFSSASLPMDVRTTISSSEFRFQEKLAVIDKRLAQILPEEFAASIQLSGSFDRAIWETDKTFHETVSSVTIAPVLTKEERGRIADEWETNLRLYIKDFTASETEKLRARIKKAVFTGNRYESVVKTIQASYGVSANKAKFLARQETSLLMTKFKETRYQSAGLEEYVWGCVAGSPAHPVRPSHKRLEGKIFRWDDPPITTAPGEPARKNNPGGDYGCRCYAKPVVRF